MSVSEIQPRPSKYFVVPFILCGAVAGIVLAVIIIYFIRRHGQQRWKLQQIAKSGNGEMGECATQDYQVGINTIQSILYVALNISGLTDS